MTLADIKALRSQIGELVTEFKKSSFVPFPQEYQAMMQGQQGGQPVDPQQMAMMQGGQGQPMDPQQGQPMQGGQQMDPQQMAMMQQQMTQQGQPMDPQQGQQDPQALDQIVQGMQELFQAVQQCHQELQQTQGVIENLAATVEQLVQEMGSPNGMEGQPEMGGMPIDPSQQAPQEGTIAGPGGMLPQQQQVM